MSKINKQGSNLGKILFSTIIISSLFFSLEVEAGRKKASSRSSKRAASTGRSSKRAASTASRAVASSAIRTTTVSDVVDDKTSASEVVSTTEVSKDNIEDLKEKIDTLLGRMDILETNLVAQLSVLQTKVDSIDVDEEEEEEEVKDVNVVFNTPGTGKIKLYKGCYSVELAGAGGGTKRNIFANWGQLGGHGGKLTGSFCLDKSVLATYVVGKGGSSGSSGGKTYLSGIDRSDVGSYEDLVALGGFAGTKYNGLKANGSRAEAGGCKGLGINDNCSVGGARNGGTQGQALQLGGAGGDGYIKIRTVKTIDKIRAFTGLSSGTTVELVEK